MWKLEPQRYWTSQNACRSLNISTRFTSPGSRTNITFPLWIDWYNISRVWNNITKIKYSIMNIGIITRVNGVWFVHKLQFNVTSDHLKLVNTEKKSCTKCCTNQKCMFKPSGHSLLLSSSVFCIWPYSMACAVPFLHGLTPLFLIQTSCYCTMNIHSRSSWWIYTPHPGRHKEVTLTMQPVSQTARVTLAPKPSSDHHYNNYKHHSLYLHKTIESACKECPSGQRCYARDWKRKHCSFLRVAWG